MATCEKCNAQVNPGAAFCPICGAGMAAPAQSEYQAPPASPVVEAEYDQAKDASDNKLMGILAYLGILVLAPILTAKESKFAMFHANQGVVLILAAIVYGIAYGILGTILTVISWRLGAVFNSIFGLGYLAFLVLMVMGILNANKGEMKELPVIGKFKLLK